MRTGWVLALRFRQADFRKTVQERRLAVTVRSGAAFPAIYTAVCVGLLCHPAICCCGCSCFVCAGVGEASVLGNEGWLDYSCFTAQFKPAVKLMPRGCCIMLDSATVFFNTPLRLCTFADFMQTLPSARDEESLVFSCSAAPHRLLY